MRLTHFVAIASPPSCIPPTANFNEVVILCHEHSDRPLPTLNPNASVLQGEADKKTVKKLQANTSNGFKVGNGVDVSEFDFAVKHEGYTMPPMILPNEGGFMSSEEQDRVGFKLPIEIQAEVRAQLAPYPTPPQPSIL